MTRRLGDIGLSYLFAFPIGEGGPRQRRSGAFVNRLLETLFFTPLCAPNLRPAGTSFQRKEGLIHSKRPTFSPLPLEGAVERSETGLAPVCWKYISPVSLSPPLSDIALYIFAAKPPPSFLTPHSSRASIQSQGAPRPRADPAPFPQKTPYCAHPLSHAIIKQYIGGYYADSLYSFIRDRA